MFVAPVTVLTAFAMCVAAEEAAEMEARAARLKEAGVQAWRAPAQSPFYTVCPGRRGYIFSIFATGG